MPHLPNTGWPVLVWCVVVMVGCLFLVFKPFTLFRALLWGRPLPGWIQNRWVLAYYRIFGAVVFVIVLKMLIEAETR
jgi:hypothetical protein